MGLEIPDLDDRAYEAFVEDAVKRIPVHAPEWTDHNVHDPGITILELLAWVAESDIYRLDRLDERHVRKYLQLMGVRPKPPQPASIRLQVEPSDTPSGTGIPAGEQLTVEDGTGDSRTFATQSSTTVTTATIASVLTERRGSRVDNTNANETDGIYYHPFGDRAPVGSSLYLGFDGDPFGDADQLQVFVDFHEENLPPPATHGDEESLLDPSVEVVWEHCTEYDTWYRNRSWDECSVSDDTAQFHRGGWITVEKPEEWVDNPEQIMDWDEKLYWLRCRVETAGYEIPPQVNGFYLNVVHAEHRARVDGPVELTRADSGAMGSGSSGAKASGPGRAMGSGSSGAKASGPGRAMGSGSSGAKASGPDAEKTTTARPGQTFAFEHSPVLDAEICVGDTTWEAVPDFDASGPDDEHYVLDPERGAILFGDNVRGTVPEAGQVVTARTYEYGGGRGGNVPEGADWQLDEDGADSSISLESDDGDGASGSGGEGDVTPLESDDIENISPLSRATGGTDAESVDAALSRLKRDLKTPYRTVSPADYRYVATHTPGLRFGRASTVVEREEPVGDCEPASTVRVVVVPFSTLDRPEPSDGFLDAVEYHLRMHRLVSDRVTVESPAYVGIAVDTQVGLREGYSRTGRAAAVEDALDAFLHPLEGFDGDGWPFGRPVYRSELYEAIERVEGIECVHTLSISARGESRTDEDGNVVIPDGSDGSPVALVHPESHSVTAAPGQRDCGGS